MSSSPEVGTRVLGLFPEFQGRCPQPAECGWPGPRAVAPNSRLGLGARCTRKGRVSSALPLGLSLWPEARPDGVAQGLSGREAEAQGPESSRRGLWRAEGDWKRF